MFRKTMMKNNKSKGSVSSEHKEIVRDDILQYELLEGNGPKGAPKGDPIMQVRDLHVSFATEAGVCRAVRGVNFDLWRGRTLGIAHPYERDPRRAYRHGVPGSAVRPDPDVHHRRPDRRRPHHPSSRHVQAADSRPLRRAARTGRHPAARGASRQLPAPVLRWYASARDDRHRHRAPTSRPRPST